MNKIIVFIIFILCSFCASSQNNNFHYVISIDSINNPVSIRETSVWLEGMFQTPVSFDIKTKSFDFVSSLDITKNLFEKKAKARQHSVSKFYKVEQPIVLPKE